MNPSLSLVPAEPPVREVPVEVVPEGDPGPRPPEKWAKGCGRSGVSRAAMANGLLAVMAGLALGQAVPARRRRKGGAS